MTGLRDQGQRTLSEQYLLDREIGRGGMVTVCLAHDLLIRTYREVLLT